MRLSLMMAFCLVQMVAFAQFDTLSYDRITNIQNPSLLAVSQFPGELDVFINARFSPTERCYVRAVQVGFGLVKFQPASGNDTLVVMVCQNGSVPPYLVNYVKTYKVHLGDRGFPNPNVNETDPLNNTLRDVLTVTLDPPVPFSPRRDFIVAVKVQTHQSRALSDGVWNGFSMLINPQITEFDRFRRYQINAAPEYSSNALLTQNGNVGTFIRAIVEYDPTMIDTTGTAVDPRRVEHFTLEAPSPNPTMGPLHITYSLDRTEHSVVDVVDALGRVVLIAAEGMLTQGSHTATVDLGSRNLTAGTYYLRMRTPSGSLIRPILLIK